MSILSTFTQLNNKWATNSQSHLAEATIVAFGSSSLAYTIEFKNGARVTNVSGPSGLSVGNSVVVASYPGKIKKFSIVQTTSGGGVGTITSVQV